MKTKIIDGTVHLKEQKFIFLEGNIKPIEKICGEMRIVEKEGITYAVLRIDNNCSYDGYMIPIVEDYDSLK